MNFAHYIKEIGRGEHGSRDLSFEDAHRLYCAMIDGGVQELELGAIVLALRMKTEGLSELLGFYQAVDERLHKISFARTDLKPIVIPCYNGARHQPNLLPLLALLLQRFGIPVLIHGTLESNGRIASAYIFRELGIMPSTTLVQLQQAFDKDHFAFVPTGVLCPGLMSLLALRNRLGVRNSAHSIVKLISPFESESVCLVSVSHPDYIEKMREFFMNTANNGLLFRGTEGEPFANPKRRPQMEFYKDGKGEVLFEAEVGPIKELPNLPKDREVKATALWTKQVLDGEIPVPVPILNQLACCLYASGYTHDMNQAKAIVALETNSLVGV